MIYEKPYMTIIVIEKGEFDVITNSYTPGEPLKDNPGGTGDGTEIW